MKSKRWLLLILFFPALSNAANYYSFASGDWATATNWTSDPTGITQVGAGIPGIGDNAFIINNKTITTAIARTVSGTTINNNCVLDLTNTAGNDLGTLGGTGKLRLNSLTLPAGTLTTFLTTGGGTVEYYDISGNLPTNLNYHNLLISNSTGTNHTVHFQNPSNPTNYTITGTYNLSKTGAGTLTVRTGTAATNIINMSITGDVTITNGCTWNAGAFNAIHNLTCNGNFTNNGTVAFSNSSQFVAASLGAINVTFTGATNKILSCNSTTNFYTLTVNKGTDAAFALRLLSNNVNNFKLFTNGNALILQNGTFRVGDNNAINRVNGGGLFTIPSTCRLWLDDGDMLIDGNSNGIQVDGVLRIENGNFSIGNEGLITGLNGQLLIEGGTSTVEKIRPVINVGIHSSSFTMTGGILNVDGTTSGSGDSQFPRFCIPYTTQGFYMTNGTINLSNPETGTAVNGGILIGCSSSNYNVTGGNVNVIIPGSATDFNIITTAPLYTLNISKAGAGIGRAILSNQTIGAGINLGSPVSAVPLVILRDLNVNTGNSPEFNANGLDVTVGRNFTIQAGTTYSPLTNNTIFNGVNTQYFNMNGTITLGLHNLVVSKPTNSTLFLGGSATSLAILNDLIINSGTFGDVNRKVNVTGNVFNSGYITGVGGLHLVGAGAQTIGGNGNGRFTTLFLNKPSGSATLTANQQVDGTIRLAGTAGILDLSNFTLNLNIACKVYTGLTGTLTNFTNAYMIRTPGISSNGGIRKRYDAANKKFLYPLGTASKYTPAYFEITGNATTYGYVSIKPVNNEHPIVTASACAITYYWKVLSTGFNLGAADVIKQFTYDQSDVISGVGVSEIDYVGGYYSPVEVKWKKTDETFVDETTNVITFDNTYLPQNIDGEFTCGDIDPNDPFSSVVAFYTIQDGDWNDVNLGTTPWSVQGFGGAPAGIFPGPENPVLIGDGIGNFHTVNVTANGQKCGNLILSNGSVLDVGTSIGHNFAVFNGLGISGGGKLRISSSTPTAEFPGGDWGQFLFSTGGVVEYYSTSVDFTIPTQITFGVPVPINLNSYKTLIFTTGTGRKIHFPNIDLSVLQTTTIAGTGTTVFNAVSTKTLSLAGSLNITSGTALLPMGGAPQNLNLTANLNITAGAFFVVESTGAAVTHILNTNGSISNNGTIDFNEPGNRKCLLNYVGVGGNRNFTGINNSAFTELATLTINKGTGQAIEVLLDVRGTLVTPDENWLFLQNGTLKVGRNYTLDLSESGPFNIPANARLWLNSSGLVMNACIGNFDNADLILGGKLQIDAGTFNVGLASNNSNNDVEYSSSSAPEIQLNGGTLFVNGQIRRNVSLLSGSLIYKQAGTSAVTINGRNQIATRAKLEVLNPGSYFEMKDNATLTIVRGGGTNFGDLYIQAISAVITGGTVQFQPGAVGSDQSYKIESTTPLFNLLIDGNTANDEALVTLDQNLIINGSLTINDNFSVLEANGFDVDLYGNFTNNNTNNTTGLTSGGFRSTTGTQVTSFLGTTASQTITGIVGNKTNFANLVINNIFPSGNVTLSAGTNITVHNLLTLTEGTFNDGGNTVVTLGDIDNSSIHTSTGSGKIACQGPVKQFIGGDGSGEFGSLFIDNASGVSTTANQRVNKDLTLNNGSLFIDYFSFRLMNNATVSGTYSGSRMIQTRGLLGDSGLIKYFNPGAINFLFPVGVDVDYTPANYNITTNTAAGSIRVAPIKLPHPATTDPLDKQLNYFWVVRGNGFSGLNVTHTYNYHDAYVTGNEAAYVGGRYVLPQWVPIGGVPGAVNDVANTITFTGNFINGDYTCGESSEFQVIDTLYSRNVTLGGNWNDPATWSSTGHGGPSAGVTPTYQIVNIAIGHTVTVTQDGETCSVIENEGTLDLEDHHFLVYGYGLGTGLMKIKADLGTFDYPIGDFTAFHASTGGTTEYYGASNGNLTAQPFYNNLRFTDNSTKVLGSINFVVNGDFSIIGGSVDNSVHNKTIDLKRNFVNDVNTSAFVPGLSTVNLSGANQSIGGTSGSTFYNLNVEGTGVKSLDKPIVVNHDLYITSTLDVTAANTPIDIKGDFINDNSFVAREGLVTFNGSNVQDIGGNTNTSFFDITVNNIFGTRLTSNQSHQNTLTVQLGTFDTDLYTHTLISTLTRTGRIAPLTSGDISGQFTMQRLAPGPLTGWAGLGTPITDAKLNQWTDDFPTSGFVGSTGTAGTFISVYTYAEYDLAAFNAPTSYIPAINANTDVLAHGLGYWVFLGTSLINTNDIMIDVTGNMFKGSVDFAPTFTSSGSLPDDGWNLVSNPYPSAIDWDSPDWTKTNMDDAIYLWQADLGQFATYINGVGSNGGTNIINSSQGFYVKAGAASPVLQATEDIKIAGNTPFLRAGQSPGNNEIIRMMLTGANGKKDEAVIRFSDNAKEEFESKSDAFKMYSSQADVPSMAIVSPDADLAISTLPYKSSMLIPVKVKATPGSYNLTFEGLNNLPQHACIILEDLVTGVKTELKNSPAVQINISNANLNTRFIIHITNPLPVVKTDASCTKAQDGAISVENDGTANNWNVSIRNTSGELVASEPVQAGSTGIYGLSAGMYDVTYENSGICGNLSVPVAIGSLSEVSAEFITGKPVENMEGVEITFVPTSNGNFTWNFGDGTEAITVGTVKHIFRQNGDFTVTCQNMDGNCNPLEQQTVNVRSSALPSTGEIALTRDQNNVFANFNFDQSTQVSINVYDALGQRACNQVQTSVSKNRLALDFSQLSQGTYLIEFRYNGHTSTSKIVW